MALTSGRELTSTRLQEEIRLLHLSLPVRPPSLNENDDYEPELVDLLRAVECPICRCIPNPPIYNCVNGHFSCGSCRPRLPSNKCAYCSANFTRMRNYPLENLVTAQAFFCDFRRSGCNQRNMTMADYEEHMKGCWFRPISTSSEKGNQVETEPANQLTCPRCSHSNSRRKVKCYNCQINLRVPTPMCSRPNRVAKGADVDETCSIDGDSL